MPFYALTALINAITSTLLGLFVYFKNRKTKVNQTFSLFCLSVAVWSYSYYFWLTSDYVEDALFWSRAFMIGAIFIPILYLHFILTLLNKVSEKKKIIIFGYLVFLIFLILDFTPLFVKEVVPELSFKFWPKPGIAFHPFLIIWFAYVAYCTYLVFIVYKNSLGVKQAQFKYILVGMTIGFIGGSTNYFLWYDIPIKPYGNILASTYVLTTAYAILKYRLMDIRMVIKRSTIFSGVVITVTMVYALVAFLFSLAAFGGGYTFKSQLITGLIVAVAVAFGFRPLYEWLKRATDAFLFKGEYRPQELMADISDVLSRTLDLNVVIQTLRVKIMRALRVEKIEVVVLEENHLSRGLKKSLEKLIEYFKDRKGTLVLEELEKKYADRIKFDKSFLLIKEIKKNKAALITALFLKEKLVGFFLLGAKKSGDIFTNEDIQTLETVAGQAAIAIENARLYEEMKDFSKTLQKEVERQTKILKEANIKLEQLDKAKSEFVSLASHQLRTPLTAIKGYVSMMLEEIWGKFNPEQKKTLEIVYSSNERLIKLVEDLLTVSRIESGRLEFNYKMISLEEITESVAEEFKLLLDKKSLYLRYEKSDRPLSKIKADPLKIRQVIMNLIDNAIRYTEKGGLTIKIFPRLKEKSVVFSVTDTGAGITPQEKVMLFEKFSRGKGISKIHTEGTGLGLYVAAKLIEAHRGKIWVESEGEGKGSTFYFELGTGE